MLRVFIGYDPRQPVSYTVLHHSIIIRTRQPVAITPLVIEQLPIRRTGLTPFTWSRFLVPWLCDFQGNALFLDSDILVQGDLAELLAFADGHAVAVAGHVEPFERAAIMAFDCAHPDNRILTPEFIETADGLHKIGWTKAIGEIPPEWAHTVLYDYPIAEPKLIHFTAGVPLWPEIKGVPFTDLWEREANAALSAVSWQKLMGNSVHVERVRAFHAQKAGLRDQTADVGNGAGRGAPEAPAGAGHGR